jgi:zinc D-Ala-D-Ala carboxypeptidase
MNLSPHFTLEEATFSDTAARLGIYNIPDDQVLNNMVIAAGLLEDLRKVLGKPISINSWYRSEELNENIPGSSKTSAHTSGFAIDCKVIGMNVLDLCKLAAKACPMYDQIIHEYGRWMHISFSPKNRKQQLTIFKGTGYKSGLLTEAECRQL